MGFWQLLQVYSKDSIPNLAMSFSCSYAMFEVFTLE